MNTYGFKEQDYLKTWLEETRDWKEYEHTHITEVEKRLTKEINDAKENINTNVDAAENSILTKIKEGNKVRFDGDKYFKSCVPSLKHEGFNIDLRG